MKRFIYTRTYQISILCVICALMFSSIVSSLAMRHLAKGDGYSIDGNYYLSQTNEVYTSNPSKAKSFQIDGLAIIPISTNVTKTARHNITLDLEFISQTECFQDKCPVHSKMLTLRPSRARKIIRNIHENKKWISL